MRALSIRSQSPNRRRVQPLPKLHLDVWVALRRDRARVSRILRKIYAVARRITHDGEGSGPWVNLVEPDPANVRTARLRTILGLRPDEDLWVELAFYPSTVRMRRIIKRIWKHPQVMGNAGALDALVCSRKTGYQATIAYAALRAV